MNALQEGVVPRITVKAARSAMPNPMFNLSPEDAIAEMQVQLEKHRAEEDRDQLKNITPDDAFDIGYETALFDYRSLTGPNPMEIIPVEIPIPQTEAEDA
jgi:hypothetical protein